MDSRSTRDQLTTHQSKSASQVKMVYHMDTELPAKFKSDQKKSSTLAANLDIPANSPSPSSDQSTLTTSFHSAGPQLEKSSTKLPISQKPPVKRATVAPYYRHSSSSIDHKTLNLGRSSALYPSPPRLPTTSDQYIRLYSQYSAFANNPSKQLVKRDPSCKCVSNMQSKSFWLTDQEANYPSQSRLPPSLQRHLNYSVPQPPKLPATSHASTMGSFGTSPKKPSPDHLMRPNKVPSGEQPRESTQSISIHIDDSKRQQSVARSMADGSLDNIQMIVDEETSACSSFGVPLGARNTSGNLLRHPNEDTDKLLEVGGTLRPALRRAPAAFDRASSLKPGDSTTLIVPQFKGSKNKGDRAKSTGTNPTGTPSTSSTNGAGFLNGVEHAVHFDDLDHLNGNNRFARGQEVQESPTGSSHSRPLGGTPSSSEQHRSTQTWGNSSARLIYNGSSKYLKWNSHFLKTFSVALDLPS